VTGLRGPVRVTRAYYYCSPCSGGFAAHDTTRRLDRREVTPAVRELAALVGIEASFPTAAHRLLERTSGVRLSESSVLRLTEETGQRHEASLRAGRTLGEATEWEWSQDAQGQTVADVEVDATGVPLQGPAGQAREGQMVDLGAILSRADAEAGLPSRVRYVTHLHELAPLGEKLRRQGAQVGMDRAQRWVALTDGGAGLESFREMNFPRAERILDFYHASLYVHQAAQAGCPGAEAEAEAIAREWKELLKTRGPTELLAAWSGWEEKCRDAESRAALAGARTYVEKNRHRMDYPRYRADGLWIGSGAIEAGCKHVINARLKQSGMRGSERGAEAVAQLRAVFRSTRDQWQALWQGNY